MKPLVPALTLALTALPAAAQTVVPGPPLPVPPVQRPAGSGFSTEGLTPQEIADQAAVMEAFVDGNKNGPSVLESHLVALRQVLDHAPARFPKWELRGEVGIVRADGEQFTALSLLAMLQAANEKRPAHVVHGFNTYPLAALLMASWCNSQKRFDEAVRWSDIGLAMQEDEEQLRAQKGQALNQLHRPAEALAVYDQALKDGRISTPVKALLLRGKGFALIDLHRLDDAEQAYNDSLKLAPNNQTALNDLKFIAQQRAKIAASTPPPPN
jgi:tetratricopeptide (TPR) repeat protein